VVRLITFQKIVSEGVSMRNISRLIRLSVLLIIFSFVSLGWPADQKSPSAETKSKSQPVSKVDLSLWQKKINQPAAPKTDATPVVNVWLQRYSDLKAGKNIEISKQPVVAQPMAPNAQVDLPSPNFPGTDQTSATVAASELVPGEFYAAWTDPFVAGPAAASLIGTAFSPAGGIPGSWMLPFSGPFLPPAPAAFTAARHPSIGSHPLGGYIASYQTWGGGAGFLGGSAIWSDANFGAGGPWGAFGPAALVMPSGAVSYLDFPKTVLDDWAGNPGPPGFGAVYYTYTFFGDGNGGDVDGNGNPFDEAPDASFILFNFSNTLGGAPVYPAISAPLPVSNPGPPSRALQSSAAVVAPSGAGPLPPGALYVAWTGASMVGAPPMPGPPPEGLHFYPTAVYIDASVAPGAGAPFGAIPGAGGANVMVAPIAPIGAIIGGGTQAMSTVDVAVNNATEPNPCPPGAVYVVWSSATLGNPDIWFSASFAGGGPGTWTPPVMVNQDATTNDQWDPAIAVDSLGNINVIYYDRRLDPGNVLTEVWMSSSFDCGVTWTDAPLSDAGPIPMVTMIPPGYIGDYLDLDENALNGAGSIWNDSRPTMLNQDVWFENTKPTCTAKAGDANASGTFTLGDPIAIVNYVFGKPGCTPVPTCWLSGLLCRGDWDGSGTVTLADVIRAVNYIFGKPGGPWLAIPIGQCCALVP
jgi:hypothetical protein